MVTSDTRERLIAGTLDTVREHGVTGVSARTIAARAGVNQALVFYHFGSVDKLLAEACRAATSERVKAYRDRFEGVTTLRGLLEVGRELHKEELAQGNVAMLAQLLAASHANPTLGEATADALRMWTAEIESVLRRVLADGPLDGLVDPAASAHALSAAFVGLELVETVDPANTADAFAELDRLGVIAEAVESLGPVARRAVRARLRRTAKKASRKSG